MGGIFSKCNKVSPSDLPISPRTRKTILEKRMTALCDKEADNIKHLIFRAAETHHRPNFGLTRKINEYMLFKSVNGGMDNIIVKAVCLKDGTVVEKEYKL